MEEMVGNPKYISLIETKLDKPVNPADIAPNGGGVDLPETPTTVTLKVTSGSERPINKIEFPNPRDNLKKVTIELIPLDGSKPKETITVEDADKPIYPTSLENIKEIRIIINEVKRGDEPKNVEISVQSCSPESTATTTKTSTTTGTGTTTTSTTTKPASTTRGRRN